MTRYAIGDVQGCDEELRALLARLRFSAERDRLWFVGDLVNRGPGSLATLRLVRSLADNAVVVLGNHDLHLLAVALGAHRRRKSDTLDAVLETPVGSMQGRYQMLADDGEQFDAPIEPFRLAMPGILQ